MRKPAPKMKRITTRLALGLLLLAMLSGCGLQLRGQVVPLRGLPQPLYLAGVEPYSPLGRELRRQLTQAGADMTLQAEQAGAVLRIDDISHGERLLSLDARNREAEAELEESLHFSLRIPQQGERVHDQVVRVVRTLLRPQGEVLARQHEEDRVRADMRQQLVNQLIRRLASQL